jgi:hypothetical protein
MDDDGRKQGGKRTAACIGVSKGEQLPGGSTFNVGHVKIAPHSN